MMWNIPCGPRVWYPENMMAGQRFAAQTLGTLHRGDLLCKHHGDDPFI